MQLVQRPNRSLTLAAAAGAAQPLLPAPWQAAAGIAGFSAGLVWSYGEAVHGVNAFRRALGLGAASLLFVRVLPRVAEDLQTSRLV